jgi:Toxin SymE, type I toxin-antitoxin system
MSERKLKVSSAWKNKRNVPTIRLIGKWLKDAGFEPDSEIVLEVSQCKIIIKKR